MKKCAYCGRQLNKGERDHVFPRCLYPKSKSNSRIQRITVPSCKECNHGWEDDEAHFRNVLTLAGEPNAARREIWNDKVLPSLNLVDSGRRISDVLSIIRSVNIKEAKRNMIFPGEDPRVLHIIRKIIRGLSHYHRIETAVSEDRVWCDVLKYEVPKEIQSQLTKEHRESDIVKYQYDIVRDDDEISSVWLFSFYEKVKFIGVVLENGM